LLEGIKTNESVFFEGKDTYSNFYTRIKAEAKKRGVNVTARTIDGGLRVWRIS
jgi:hypothetical protein